MNETFDDAGSRLATDTPDAFEPTPRQDAAVPQAEVPAGSDSDEAPKPAEDPVAAKFASCRWHATQDNGGAPYCSHRDVRPYAGVNGFKPQAWCPECKFFKVRRTVKRRNPFDLDEY